MCVLDSYFVETFKQQANYFLQKATNIFNLLEPVLDAKNIY